MEIILKLLEKYSNVFIDGLFGTLWLAAITVLIGTVLGILVALMRMSKIKIVNGISTVYVEILRGTPVLLQLYFFWIGIPKFFPALNPSEAFCITVALIINSSAYISEIIRAGINAVDKGQWEAARSLGLTPSHVMTRVILPQATKNILPALGNQFIAMVKETSLASVFFVGELTTSYKTVQSITYRTLEPLIIVGIIYLILNYVLSYLVSILERRLQVSD